MHVAARVTGAPTFCQVRVTSLQTGSRTASRFTTEELTSVVLAKGFKLSMDGQGAWCDNVFVERLRRSVKDEPVYLKAMTR